MGPIEPADGLSVAEFIGKAFNDELKMAGAHSENGTKISGNETKISFSSISGLTNGNWDVSILLTSSNGKLSKYPINTSLRAALMRSRLVMQRPMLSRQPFRI